LLLASIILSIFLLSSDLIEIYPVYNKIVIKISQEMLNFHQTLRRTKSPICPYDEVGGMGDAGDGDEVYEVSEISG
jgi:hypothetical protein